MRVLRAQRRRGLRDLGRQSSEYRAERRAGTDGLEAVQRVADLNALQLNTALPTEHFN